MSQKENLQLRLVAIAPVLLVILVYNQLLESHHSHMDGDGMNIDKLSFLVGIVFSTIICYFSAIGIANRLSMSFGHRYLIRWVAGCVLSMALMALIVSNVR